MCIAQSFQIAGSKKSKVFLPSPNKMDDSREQMLIVKWAVIFRVFGMIYASSKVGRV